MAQSGRDRESGKGWQGKVRGEERWEEREQGEMTVNSHLGVHSGPRESPAKGQSGEQGRGDIGAERGEW